MAFNYQSAGPAGQTVLSPTSKDVQCKSLKIDLSVTNATTATAYDLSWLPKDAQIVFSGLVVPTAVSGPSVSAATIQITAGGANVYSGQNVFAVTGLAIGPSANYYNIGLAPTTDQKLQYTLTLTGGATATAGVIYVNIFYVV